MSRILIPAMQIIMTRFQDLRRKQTNPVVARLMDFEPDGLCRDCGFVVLRFGDNPISCVNCYYRDIL